jgi:hypothetical protein
LEQYGEHGTDILAIVGLNTWIADQALINLELRAGLHSLGHLQSDHTEEYEMYVKSLPVVKLD